MLTKKILIIGLFISSFGLFSFMNLSKDSPRPVSSRSAVAILQWNEIAFNAFGGTQYQHSLMASRINAMVHLAIHDALNGIEEKYSRYAFAGVDKNADPFAAAAVASYEVLVHEIPGNKKYLDSVLENALNGLKEGNAKAKGIALGKAAARAVINKRANDGSAGNPIVQIPAANNPGAYQVVAPFNFVFAPYWQDVKPFAIGKSNQFRSAPFPSLTSDKYTKAFEEVKQTGKVNSSTRTPDQTAYAKFWYEFSEAGWNRVARTVVSNQKLNMLEAARLFALVDMAIADAYIAGWDSKFHYNFWRPYTAIRNAGHDGNDATMADASWEPSEPTPPVHDYPSTHSALGNAAATVLALLLGDNTAFSMTSPTAYPAGTIRSFNSFSQAANENADSRVRAGIHFRFSCEAGQEMGNKIGAWTVANCLKPIK